MQAIRRAAVERSIEWNDAWFFEAPAEQPAPQGEVA
jgi:hypothetical protein